MAAIRLALLVAFAALLASGGAEAKVYHFYEDWAAGAATVLMGLALAFSNKLFGEPA